MHTRFGFCVCLGLIAFLLVVPVFAQDTETNSTTNSDTPTETKPVGRTITLSDFGAEDLAYLAIPVTPPSMGLVLVPDAFGLDDFTKTEADRLAALGYLVLAVDIYNGHHSTDPEEIANMISNQEPATVMKTIAAGVRVFHESPKFKVGHVVAIGWGNGGRFVFQATRDDKTIDGAVMFYGPVESNVERIGKFASPLCAVYPDHDPISTHANVQVFQHMMKDAGNDFEAWFIAAGTGWSDPASKSYNPVEDQEAWKVVMPFLVRIGAEPVKAQKAPSLIDKAKDKFKSLFQ